MIYKWEGIFKINRESRLRVGQADPPLIVISYLAFLGGCTDLGQPRGFDEAELNVDDWAGESHSRREVPLRKRQATW